HLAVTNLRLICSLARARLGQAGHCFRKTLPGCQRCVENFVNLELVLRIRNRLPCGRGAFGHRTTIPPRRNRRQRTGTEFTIGISAPHHPSVIVAKALGLHPADEFPFGYAPLRLLVRGCDVTSDHKVAPPRADRATFEVDVLRGDLPLGHVEHNADLIEREQEHSRRESNRVAPGRPRRRMQPRVVLCRGLHRRTSAAEGGALRAACFALSLIPSSPSLIPSGVY